jgi:hypothetical protein
MRKRLILSILSLLFSSSLLLAQTDSPEMADTLRANGKIYVVVLVLATIFAGLIGFMVYIDRKISKLEKNQ